MAKSTKNKPPQVPQLADDPAYVAAQKKLQDLDKQRRECAERVAALTAKIKTATPVSRVHAKADALLDGGDPADDTVTSDGRKLAELHEHEEACGLALKEQRRRLSDEVGLANLRFQPGIQSSYKPLVEATADAAITFARCVQAEIEFKAGLERQGLYVRAADAPTRRCFGKFGTGGQGVVGRWLAQVRKPFGVKTPDDFLTR